MRGKDFAEVIRVRNFCPAQIRIANNLTMIAHYLLPDAKSQIQSIRDLSILSSSNRLGKAMENNNDSYRVDRCPSSIR